MNIEEMKYNIIMRTKKEADEIVSMFLQEMILNLKEQIKEVQTK